MKKFLTVLIAFSLLVLYSCKDKETNIQAMNNEFDSIEVYKRKVFLYGDATAYNSLRVAYLDYPNEDLLIWAMLMSNKYKSEVGALDIYRVLGHFFHQEEPYSKKIMGEEMYRVAIESLKLAASRGDSTAKNTMKAYYK